MFQLRVLSFIAAFILAGGGVFALADEIENLVDNRQKNFKVLGKNAKALRSSIGKSNWDEAKEQAMAMTEASARILAFFPPESAETFASTDAKPAIWKNFTDFTDKQAVLDQRLAALNKAVDAKDSAASKKALKAVGKACKDCHKKYKED